MVAPSAGTLTVTMGHAVNVEERLSSSDSPGRIDSIGYVLDGRSRGIYQWRRSRQNIKPMPLCIGRHSVGFKEMRI